MQIFGGLKRCIMGFVQVVNGQNSKEYLNQSEASRSNYNKYKGMANTPPLMKEAYSALEIVGNTDISPIHLFPLTLEIIEQSDICFPFILFLRVSNC